MANTPASAPITTTVAAAKGKENPYAMRPIPPILKSTKENEPKLISMYNQGEFLVKSKETKQSFSLVVKEEVVSILKFSRR